ncbi:MAG: hypothetical protein EXQ81_10585 [Thermoleophilia bacterium]|nr:hypothetical protein [Thermoleophilia bacterium]
MTGIAQRVGADVGGTFTDVILEDDQGRIAFTTATTRPPADRLSRRVERRRPDPGLTLDAALR